MSFSDDDFVLSDEEFFHESDEEYSPRKKSKESDSDFVPDDDSDEDWGARKKSRAAASPRNSRGKVVGVFRCFSLQGSENKTQKIRLFQGTVKEACFSDLSSLPEHLRQRFSRQLLCVLQKGRGRPTPRSKKGGRPPPVRPSRKRRTYSDEDDDDDEEYTPRPSKRRAAATRKRFAVEILPMTIEHTVLKFVLRICFYLPR